MKALSLRQPWAALVLHYGKDVENRRWLWGNMLGATFLIHAAGTMTRGDVCEAVAFARQAMGDRCPSERDVLDRVRLGGVVGRARIAAFIPPCGAAGEPCTCVGTPWHMPDQHGLALCDVTELPFLACRGMYGFFEPKFEEVT